ncbi:MAG: proton-conducting transporter membrane subunit [Candidatus Verstraetearchaeota archaeon]|nr:proton-conducting transporter membrane subunit [Candidatus Verstraetearchaeota archaeon]
MSYLGLDLNFNLSIDGISLIYSIAIASVSAAVCVYSVDYMDHRVHEMGLEGEDRKKAFSRFYSAYLLFYLGMIGTVISTNIVQFYLFYELILISTWLLIHIFGYGEKEKIALTYFIWTHLSGLLVLIGFAFHYMATGSIAMVSFNQYSIGSLLLLIGFSIKMAAFGLHTWLPLAHGEAPTPISALLSPVTIGIGAYGIIRMALPAVVEFSNWVLLWALVTIVFGGLMALSEDDIKRLLAYSSISHMGYMMLGIASLTYIGISGVVYHYLTHAFLKAVLFMGAGAIMMQLGGIRKISLMGGLASKTPIVALFLASGFLGLAGFPPFPGFNSKLIILAGAFSGANGFASLCIVAGAAFSSILTIAYGAEALRRSMFGEIKEGLEVKRLSNTMVLPMVFMLLLAILFFFMPWLVILPLEA